MSKFNPILMDKVHEEKRTEKKQAKLKEEAGIEGDNVSVKEKGAKDYVKEAGKCMLYIIFIALVFLGIITVLSPELRQEIIGAAAILLPQ